MLDQLPVEILRMVVQDVTSGDITNLSKVSKGLHRSLIPILHQNVVIRAREECVSHLNVPPMVKTFFKEDGSMDQSTILPFVKDLQFVAPVNLLRRRRCYQEIFKADEIGIVTIDEVKKSNQPTHDTVMEDLLHAFNDSVQGLSKDCLRSFTWGLGCCIPSEVIGRDGYIPKYQTCIRSLSLTTDGTCWNHLLDYSGLLELRQLRHLSWKGVDRVSKTTIIRELLEANCKHLESLELETVEEDSSQLHVYHFTGDPELIEEAVHFPALQHLTLSGISLYGPYRRMELSFPLEKLWSLRIRHCDDGLSLLTNMAKECKAIKLRCLEVVYTEERGDEAYNGVHPIDQFLESFTGLEELYISLRDITFPSRDLYPSILRHRETLKRLVHHERSWDFDSNSERHHCIRGYETPWFKYINDMSAQTWTECLGVCIPPYYLEHTFERCAMLENFKLIHLRITARHYGARDLLGELKHVGYSPDEGVITSGATTEFPAQTTPRGAPVRTSRRCKDFISMKQLLYFAQWAFGPDGFPKLSVLAYGDFSHHKRFKWSQLLFCRADPTSTSTVSTEAAVQPATFRLMTHDDEYLLDAIDGGREMLSACPIESNLDFQDEIGSGSEEVWFDPYDNGLNAYISDADGVDEDDDDDGFDHGFSDQDNDEDVEYIDIDEAIASTVGTL